jgi:hypothetical protein
LRILQGESAGGHCISILLYAAVVGLVTIEMLPGCGALGFGPWALGLGLWKFGSGRVWLSEAESPSLSPASAEGP